MAAYLRKEFAEQLNNFFVISSEVVKLHTVLKHALLLGIFGDHFDDLESKSFVHQLKESRNNTNTVGTQILVKSTSYLINNATPLLIKSNSVTNIFILHLLCFDTLSVKAVNEARSSNSISLNVTK
jgi:hypothetical protein